MSDVNSSGPIPPQGGAGISPVAAHPPFPVVRLFYSVLFGIMAYLALVLLIALAIVQFVVLGINGKLNDELKAFSANLVQYIWQCLSFIVFARDDQPFPMGPFPNH